MKILVILLGLTLGIGAIAYLFYFLRKFIKDRALTEIDKTTFKKLVVPSAILFISMPIFLLGISLTRNIHMDALHYLLTIIGGALFGAGLGVFITCFTLRYYKTNLANDNIKTWISRTMFISIPVIFIALLGFMEGFGPYLAYPLYNSICFGSDGKFISLLTSDDVANGGLKIAFYGIIIVTGAVVVYFICDHKFYKTYHKHGLLDTCFLVAFPMGIIGARLWFCLVLRTDYYLANPGEIIRMWDGGLAIMGGAILGIISGTAFLLIFRRYINIRQALDIIVPCILIAQGIGRWGNFFNHEVYGNIVSSDSMRFLPTFIRNQMATDYTVMDEMYIPLFLIESISNIAGYFIIVYAIGKPLKKILPLGSRSGLYLIWYGLTRAIMEPMRYGESGSVDKFDNSWYASFGLIAGGALLILAFFIYELIMKKKCNKTFEEEKNAL